MPMRIRPSLTSAPTLLFLLRCLFGRAGDDHVLDGLEAAISLLLVDGDIGPAAGHRLASRLVGGRDGVVAAAARHVPCRSDADVLTGEAQLEIGIADQALNGLPPIDIGGCERVA